MRKTVICQRILLVTSLSLITATLILCPTIITQAIDASAACKLEELQPSSADTHIDSVFDDNNYAGMASISIALTQFKSVRGLVKFDLSSIPLGSTVNTASLKLYYSGSGGAPTGRTFTVYKITKDWVENEATWNSYQTGSPWGTPGGDYSTEGASSTTVPSSVGLWMTWNATSIVKAWIEDGQPNYGFLIKDLNEVYPPSYGVNFDARESPVTGWRPILVIGWCEAPTITEPEPVGGEILPNSITTITSWLIAGISIIGVSARIAYRKRNQDDSF